MIGELEDWFLGPCLIHAGIRAGNNNIKNQRAKSKNTNQKLNFRRVPPKYPTTTLRARIWGLNSIEIASA